MLSVVIATKDRPFTLATTIYSIIANPIAEEIIIVNTGESLLEKGSYFKAFYESLIMMDLINIKIIDYETDCVAKARVKGIETSENNYCFMCDDDDLIEYSCLGKMVDDLPIEFGAVASVFFEALNLPNYPDWNTHKYSSMEEFINSGNDLRTMQFHLWNLMSPRICLPIDHISTHGIWNRKALDQGKVLDFWYSYPDKTPNYDYFGSKLLAKNSTLYFQSNAVVYHLQHSDQKRFWKHEGVNSDESFL